MKLPLSRALICIFLSVIVISGPAFLGLLYYQSLLKSRSEDSRYLVRTIEASSNALPLDYLCEWLDLSVDHPSNLYQLKKPDLEKKLLSSPLIREAKVSKVLPDKLMIHYLVRKPIALLGDYHNVAIDHKGFIFPYRPFFADKKLPIFYLGEKDCAWNRPIKGPHFQTALKLYKLLPKESLHHIDVSKLSEKSLGKREIVVTLEEEERQIFLRLTPDNYLQELTNFQKIGSFKGSIVDLRIPQLAFISK